MGEQSSVIFDARDYLHPRYWLMWLGFGVAIFNWRNTRRLFGA